jgi:hypothetical chaperone protein
MIVGMDFGTTNSGMSVFDGSGLHLIPLDPANANPAVARTALYITNDRSVHIGRQAIDTYYEQNLNRPFMLDKVRVGEIEMTFAEIGTFIRDVYIEKDVYSPGRLFLSFKMGLSSSELLGTVVGTEYYFLEDIIATYLYVTRRRAENHLNRELDTIVLGRPVRYSDDPTQNEVARERMLQAAFRAGYKTVYLQYEPIAAAYHYESTISKTENVLIFDFGGGTLDISIMRLGDPKTREVLATGGIPVAGDVFDQKIVREKMPPHFGEGDTYLHGDQVLPIPSSFFEAFANWQELLLLQLPNRLESLKYIAWTAQNPRKIQALINLVTSSYGLKLFDLAEAAKQELSSRQLTYLKVQEPDFPVYDTLSRADFERLIRRDVRAIAARLDEVIQQAGLSHHRIDAVIRTGGSSQIPAFIDMLNERFGADKVHDIDIFSSVTSGLGIIAHEIEAGRLNLPAYTPASHPADDYLNTTHQGGIPVVDLGTVKKFIDLAGQQAKGTGDSLVLAGVSADGRLKTAAFIGQQLEAETRYKPSMQIAAMLPADERLLVMTTEYRLLLKGAQHLVDMAALGLDFETTEDFHVDQFGAEQVCALAHWCDLQDAELTALVSTRGYGRLFVGSGFITNVDRPMPYQIDRSPGYPAALLKVAERGALVVISHAGRAVRFPVEQMMTLDQRILRVSTGGKVIAALYIDTPQEIIVITAGGYATRISTTTIPLTTEPGTSGVKVISRAQPVAALVCRPGKRMWAVTTQRVVPVDQTKIPVNTTSETDIKLLKLKKGETVISLVYGG